MDENIPDLFDTALLKKEFEHLKDSCYLDHTGAALYAKSQVEAISKDLSENLYSNPHSNSLPSRLCADTVDQVRFRILQYFNTTTNDYSVIFTSGATEALKIVAETFDFAGNHVLEEDTSKRNTVNSCGEFVYLQDNHTSVLGMRNVDNIKLNRVPCRSVSQSEAIHILEAKHNQHSQACQQDSVAGNSLFVYPAQCNFSGVKYPLSWVKVVQSGALEEGCNQICRKCKWFCLLDAATHVSTNPLDLSSVCPDFVTISFYKIFGLPTGLGALLVRNTSASVLHKKYYGGGTVQVALSSRPTHVLRPFLHERFEDGTINFLSIIALRHGMDWHKRAGLLMNKVTLHCYKLARYTHVRLRRLHHSNGLAAVCLYADTAYDDPTTQGNIVNFNMCRDTGEFVGFMEVLNLTNLHGIHLRTGCFCNPGACQRHLGISEEQYFKNFQAGHVCGDDKDLIDGQPTGSVRVSFGPYSTQEHADRLINMLTDCFVSKPTQYREPDNWAEAAERLRSKFKGLNLKHAEKEQNSNRIGTKEDISYNETLEKPSIEPKYNGVSSQRSVTAHVSSVNNLRVSRVCLYPVKSCGSMQVDCWPLDQRGLLYDRCWMIVTDSLVALTQKQEPRLCLIKPFIDLKNEVLKLTFKGYPSCSVPFTMDQMPVVSESWMCQSKVCGNNIRGVDCGEAAATWLCLVLNRHGLRLIRYTDSTQRIAKKKDHDGSASSLALSNQAQYLLINEKSVSWLAEKLSDNSDCTKLSMVDRFRSNFVIEGDCPAFEEQMWKEVVIGSISFKVDGPCGRCQMICIDQTTGQKTKEPLTTLAANWQGRIKFGIYLSRRQNSADSVSVSVGDQVVPSFT